jgi:YggT family protein
MLVDIARFLLEILGSLLVALLLLRAWMRFVGLPPRNPLMHFARAMTDWLVAPLARIVPSAGRIDWAAIVAGLIVTLLILLLLRTVIGAGIQWEFVLLAAARQFLVWTLNVIVWVTVIYVVLSWVNPHAPFAPALDLMLRPMLEPIRRVLPTVGGFDLSPLVLLIGVYVLQMVIARL